MPTTATKNCEWCGESYDRHRSFGREQWAVSRFCSRQCRGASIKGISTGPRPKSGTDMPCGTCGKPFYVFPYRQAASNQGRFCSQACSYKGRVLKGTFKKGHPDVVPIEARKRAGAKTSVTLTGRPLSEQHRAKIGAANLGKVHSKEHIRKSLQRRPMSSLEKKFNEIIASSGLKFRFVGNGALFVGRKNPDFVATDGTKTAVEVFYRRHKERFAGGLDKWKSERELIFKEQGWNIVFFDETQVQAERVKAALGGV